MNKKKAVTLIVCGAATTLLSGVLIIMGILEGIERSQYQNLGLNIPMIILVGTLFIGGVAALIKGVRGMKSDK